MARSKLSLLHLAQELGNVARAAGHGLQPPAVLLESAATSSSKGPTG